MPENIFSSKSYQGIPFPGGFESQPKFKWNVKSPHSVEEDEVVSVSAQNLPINVST